MSRLEIVPVILYVVSYSKFLVKRVKGSLTTSEFWAKRLGDRRKPHVVKGTGS